MVLGEPRPHLVTRDRRVPRGCGCRLDLSGAGRVCLGGHGRPDGRVRAVAQRRASAQVKAAGPWSRSPLLTSTWRRPTAPLFRPPMGRIESAPPPQRPRVRPCSLASVGFACVFPLAPHPALSRRRLLSRAASRRLASARLTSAPVPLSVSPPSPPTQAPVSRTASRPSVAGRPPASPLAAAPASTVASCIRPPLERVVDAELERLYKLP